MTSFMQQGTTPYIEVELVDHAGLQTDNLTNCDSAVTISDGSDFQTAGLLWCKPALLLSALLLTGNLAPHQLCCWLPCGPSDVYCAVPSAIPNHWSQPHHLKNEMASFSSWTKVSTSAWVL